MINNISQDSNDPLSLALSPTGHLYLYTDAENSETVLKTIADNLQSFFSVNDTVGLLRLGLTHFDVPLPTSFNFWQQFAQLFITEVCKQVDGDNTSNTAHIALPIDAVTQLIVTAPFIRGIEYFNQDTAQFLWQGLLAALSNELISFDGKLNDYLSAFHTVWNTIGRVCFHLAENKSNLEY